jgi:hypothetical protein
MKYYIAMIAALMSLASLGRAQGPDSVDLIQLTLSGRAPNVAASVTYSARAQARSVELAWMYRVGDKVLTNTTNAATRFRPTSIVQLQGGDFVVAGKNDDNSLVVERWTMKYPEQLPLPNYSLATGEAVYPPFTPTITARKVAKRLNSSSSSECIQHIFEVQKADSGVETSAVFLHLSTGNFTKLDLNSGALSVEIHGSASPTGLVVPNLAQHWYGVMSMSHASHGVLYVFQNHDDVYVGAMTDRAIVIADSDGDGSIDSVTEFASPQLFETYISWQRSDGVSSVLKVHL